jgi:ABC-type Co2+ transport system permease subunit
MAGVHAIIGMVEGAITVMVLGFLERVRPDLLRLEGI